MRLLPILMAGLTVGLLGCARVSVQGSKEPIRLDISMRLDIYQHVKNDIDDIENMVSGPKDQAKPKDKQSFLGYFIADAYAQEGLGPDVEQAAMRRKERRSELAGAESRGAIGENKSGMVEIRNGDGSLQGLVSAENQDRTTIYRAVAQKNGAAIEDVQKLYAKRLQSDAPSGTPIEGPDGWAKK
jgi:uncharacterized protein